MIEVRFYDRIGLGDRNFFYFDARIPCVLPPGSEVILPKAHFTIRRYMYVGVEDPSDLSILLARVKFRFPQGVPLIEDAQARHLLSEGIQQGDYADAFSV